MADSTTQAPAAADRIERQSAQAPPDDLSPFVRRLERAQRDVHGKLLPVGTAVLCNPELAPEEVMEDTPANRIQFRALFRTWKPQTRAKVYLPPEIGDELAARLSAAVSDRNRFTLAIKENMRAAKGQPFPDVHPPGWYAYVPFEPPTSSVSEPIDLSADLLAALRSESGVPADIPWPEQWDKKLAEVNEMKLYVLRRWGAEVHVIVAFLTPLNFIPGSSPRLVPPDARIVNLVREVHRKSKPFREGQTPRYVFFTLASASGWDATVDGLSGGDFWVTCSSPLPDNRWEWRWPVRPGDRASLVDFLERLRPETREDRYHVIWMAVDEMLGPPLLDPRGENLVSMERLKARVHYRRSSVLEALRALEERRNYRLYRARGEVSTGWVVSRRISGKRPVHFMRPGGWSRAIWQMLIGGIIIVTPQLISTLTWNFYTGASFHASMLGISLVTAYGSSLAIKHLSRLKEDEKE